VRVDLKRHQSKRIKRGRLHNRHVVGRADRGRGDIRTGAGAHVDETFVHTATNRDHQVGLLERREQPEGVATPDKYRLGPGQRLHASVVGSHHARLDAVPSEPLPRFRRVAVAVQDGERHERQPSSLREQVEHLGHTVVEIVLAVIGGVTDEEEAAGHAVSSHAEDCRTF
jgi:hypothetical protein